MKNTFTIYSRYIYISKYYEIEINNLLNKKRRIDMTKK